MGRKRLDLIGQKFNKLTVISLAYIKKGTYWNCKCDCGNETIVSSSHLKSGAIKGCGCQLKLDITGQRFGRLKAMEFDHQMGNRAHWRCLCDCGKETIIYLGNLRNGHTQSCGCLRKEILSELLKNNIRGKDPSAETRKKLSIASSRENNPNWNPNLTDENRINRRHIPGYKEWVQAVLKRDDYTCQVCGKRGGNLIAHHLESYNSNPKLRTILSNGATVCEEHHKDFHHQYGYGNNTEKQFIKFKGGLTK